MAKWSSPVDGHKPPVKRRYVIGTEKTALTETGSLADGGQPITGYSGPCPV